MRGSGFLIQATAFALLIAGLSASAAAEDNTRGAMLSAALGGSLGDGMSEAGGLGHGRLDATVARRPGRSEVFRRQLLAEAAQRDYAVASRLR